ncbi:hypothetical protein Droror1_Dr00007291 [Drosera rotundifolia]
MVLLQRYEFKRNHEEWMKSVKPKLGRVVSYHVHAANDTVYKNIETLYKVTDKMREALQTLLKQVSRCCLIFYAHFRLFFPVTFTDDDHLVVLSMLMLYAFL